MRRGVHRPPRFRSRVFSTPQRFPGTPGDRGLVSCRSRPWGSPFRALLLVEVACASRRRLLPCSWSPSYLNGDARDLIPRAFTDARALARWPGSTRSSTAVSDAANRAFPDDLGPAHRDPLVPTASSASKPCSLHEAVRSKDGCPPPDRRCSPGLRPSRAFLRSSLGPSTPDGLSVRPALRPTHVRPSRASFRGEERGYLSPPGETGTTSRSRGLVES